jgi:hypothetical protein
MKRFFNKFILISNAIVISFLVVHGIAYTQQVCCNDMTAVCFQAPNRILGGSTGSKSWTKQQAYGPNILLESNLCFRNNFDPGDACCETDSCDFYKQSVHISLSSAQYLYPLQDGRTTFEIDMIDESSYDPQILYTSLEPEPIYILTKSILC